MAISKETKVKFAIVWINKTLQFTDMLVFQKRRKKWNTSDKFLAFKHTFSYRETQ